MLFYLFLSSQLIAMVAGYYLLEKIYQERKIYTLIVVISFLTTFVINSSLSVISMFILFIIFFYLSNTLHPERSVGETLLVVSLVFIMSEVSELVMHPFLMWEIRRMPASFSNNLFISTYLILTIILVLIAVFLWKRYLLPFMSRRFDLKKTGYLAGIGVGVFLSYQLIDYVRFISYYKQFITIFVYLLVLFLLMFITVLRAFVKNQHVQHEAERERAEYEAMKSYTAELDQHYQVVRQFRHDYMNILSVIEGFLVSKDLEGLENYYVSSIQPSKHLFEAQLSHLNDLSYIASSEVRGLLASKLTFAQEKNIQVRLEISEPILKTTFVRMVSLIRILGILLDNAIEEVEAACGGQLAVALFKSDDEDVIVIENTARTELPPVAVLREKGYSTKGDGRGMGLSIVQELLIKEPSLFLETTSVSGKFTQKLILTKGSEQP